MDIILAFPANHIAERNYVASFLLNALGLECQLTPKEGLENYQLYVNDRLIASFEDHFFSDFNDDLSYLRLDNVPTSTKKVEYLDQELQIIFGRDHFEKTEQGFRIGVDIFASAFFMLSRWEEHVIPDRDVHGRFPDRCSLSIKETFYTRPIVQEYIRLLHLIFEANSVKTNYDFSFQYYWTSDLEYLRKYEGTTDVIRSVMGSLLKRFDFKEAFLNLKEGMASLKNSKNDPYSKGLAFLDSSCRENLKLYVIPSIHGEVDARYSYKELPTYLSELNCDIGIHPSYTSFDSFLQLQEEYGRLKDLKIEVDEGRQHYFRFSTPETWRSWNKLGIKQDSSIGFTEHGGFRAGIAWSYPVFDILEREELDLMELPTVIMDVALRKEFPNDQDFIGRWNDLESISKRYGAKFCVLWHPNNVDHGQFRSLFKFLNSKISGN